MASIVQSRRGHDGDVSGRLAGRRRSSRQHSHLRLVPALVTTRCDPQVGPRWTDSRPAMRVVDAEPVSAWPQTTPRVRRPRFGEPAASARQSQTLATDRGRLTITPRGRLLILVVVAALILLGVLQGVGALIAGAASSPSDGARPVAVQTTVTVLPGETLWGIARRVAPERDARDVVIQIRDANGLPDSRVFAGQRLDIPEVDR